MGIVGVKSEGGDKPHLSLQQTKSVRLPATSPAAVTTRVSGNENIKNYLYPNTLTGILVSLFIVFVMIIAFLQLMAGRPLPISLQIRSISERSRSD